MCESEENSSSTICFNPFYLSPQQKIQNLDGHADLQGMDNDDICTRI